MERINVYIRNGYLAVDLYDMEAMQQLDVRGMERDVLEAMFKLQIRDFYDDDINKTLTVKYDDCIFVMQDYDIILSNKNLYDFFSQLIQSVKNFSEIKESKKLKPRNKKVTRKNKYGFVKMITITLLLAIIITFIASITSHTMPENIDVSSSTSFSMPSNIDIGDITKFMDISYEDTIDVSIHDDETVADPIEDSVQTEAEPVEDSVQTVTVVCGDRTGTSKYQNTKEKYKAVIDKYCAIYGLDPSLMLAVATQESGNHEANLESGPAVGLMQIEKGVYRNGGELSAYNFETNSWERVVVTKDNYPQFVENLKNLEYNVKFACMTMQYCLKCANYNPVLALQTYNMGYGNIYRKVVPAYCADTSKSIDDVKNDCCDIGWADYRYLASGGDKQYIENVLSYVEDSSVLKFVKPDNSVVELSLSKNALTKTIAR